jgi:excinuclease ABC subunit C
VRHLDPVGVGATAGAHAVRTMRACPDDRTPSPRCRPLRACTASGTPAAACCTSGGPESYAAGSAQAYEAAARLQEEIEAVEWVVAPQRVTAPGEEGDQDVTAWGDDVLVRLRIRNGRLRAWEQETCSRPVPGTRPPDGWVPFLRRNAELAARLAALPVS